MTAFDTMMAGAYTALRSVFGEAATYKSGGTGSGTSITVTVATTLPQSIMGSDDGRENKREVYLGVLVTDVATPKRGDTYTLASTAHAGIYTQKHVEKRSGTRWLILATKDDLDELGNQHARETAQ